MKENQPSGMERSISGFANTLAAIGALFLVPYVVQHFRLDVYYYILADMSHAWAYWGSWLFVVLAAACCYFGGSTFLQVLVQVLFRRSARKGGF